MDSVIECEACLDVLYTGPLCLSMSEESWQFLSCSVEMEVYQKWGIEAAKHLNKQHVRDIVLMCSHTSCWSLLQKHFTDYHATWKPVQLMILVPLMVPKLPQPSVGICSTSCSVTSAVWCASLLTWFCWWVDFSWLCVNVASYNVFVQSKPNSFVHTSAYTHNTHK